MLLLCCHLADFAVSSFHGSGSYAYCIVRFLPVSSSWISMRPLSQMLSPPSKWPMRHPGAPTANCVDRQTKAAEGSPRLALARFPLPPRTGAPAYSASNNPWAIGKSGSAYGWASITFDLAPFLRLRTGHGCRVAKLTVAPTRLDRQGRSVAWMVKY